METGKLTRKKGRSQRGQGARVRAKFSGARLRNARKGRTSRRPLARAPAPVAPPPTNPESGGVWRRRRATAATAATGPTGQVPGTPRRRVCGQSAQLLLTGRGCVRSENGTRRGHDSVGGSVAALRTTAKYQTPHPQLAGGSTVEAMLVGGVDSGPASGRWFAG